MDINKIIYERLSYDKALNYLMKIHLKYYILKLEKECFTTQYAFNFIKYIEKENIIEEECDKYFKEEKYIFYSNNDALPGKIDDIINAKILFKWNLYWK